MSKKNHEAVARVMAKGMPETGPRRSAVVSIAAGLATYFKEDNPRFDVYSFMDTCTIKTDEYRISGGVTAIEVEVVT